MSDSNAAGMRRLSVGAILVNGIFGGFASAFIVLALVYLPDHENYTLAQKLQAAFYDALYYGIPVGFLVFGLSNLALGKLVDFRRALPFLYLGTIVGGYLGTIRLPLLVGYFSAIGGYFVALLLFILYNTLLDKT